MPENEVAPCALCLQVEEAGSMLQVDLPPSQGEPGIRRRLCAGCVSSIEAAMQESDRWAKQSKTVLRQRRGREDRGGATPGASEPARGDAAGSHNDGSDQEAKVPETLE